MKINSGRGNLIMQQQMLAQRANKANTSSNQAKNAGGSDNDGDNDGGGETSRTQKSEQTGGINYKQLTAAVNAGVVRPSSVPRNREANNGNGDTGNRGVSARQSEQAAKTGGDLGVKQNAAANSAQPNCDESGGYTRSAQTDKQQSSYAKGNIVNLTA